MITSLVFRVNGELQEQPRIYIPQRQSIAGAIDQIMVVPFKALRICRKQYGFAWTNGPDNRGRTRGFAINPQNPTEMYAGSVVVGCTSVIIPA